MKPFATLLTLLLLAAPVAAQSSEADLALSAVANPSFAPSGQQVAITITITNQTTGETTPATGVEATLYAVRNLDLTGIRLVNQDGQRVECDGGGSRYGVETYVCSFGEIAPGESVQYDILARVTDEGGFSYFAEITESELPDPDSTPDNDNGDFTFDEDDEDGAGDGVLPVELTTFDATLDGDRVLLRWTTASETNNSGFAVQRAAANGVWRDVAWVPGAGTTLEARQYAASDAAIDRADTDVLVYRLRQVDLDGAENLSFTVEVSLADATTDALASVWPQPSAGQMQSVLTLARSGAVRAALYDAIGRQVAVVHEGMTAEGRTPLRFDTSSLASGTYVLRVRTDRTVLSQTVVVAR
jgi:hypothetical protein